MNTAQIVERMDHVDAQILAEYGAGGTPTGIAKKLGVTLDDVSATIRDIANTDRGAATTLSLAWQKSPAGKRWKAEQAKAAKPADPEPKAEVDKATAARPTPHLDAVKAELDDERRLHQATADELVKVVNELAAIDSAAGRDIAKPDEPLLDRIADLKRGREEATERALELAKRVAELEALLEHAEQHSRDLQDDGVVVEGADALLAAEASGDVHLMADAKNVRADLADLATRVERWQKTAPLREELARIEARAAEIRAQLGVAS